MLDKDVFIMSQVRKNKRSLGSMISKYRKIIFLTLFFVLLPVILVIGIYSGTKANGEKIRFSEEGAVVKASKIEDVSGFNEFNLTIKYTEIAPLYDTEDKDKKIGNKYTFTITYNKNLHDISNVSVTGVLVAPWNTYQELKTPQNLTEGRSHSMVFDFKKETPYSPLWFVNVDYPILYLEVKYTLAGLEQVRHLKYDLGLGNPRVIESK